jgi:hypothetical protein
MDSQHIPPIDTSKKHHPLFNTFLLLAIVYIVIEIARSGYHFGQWLQHAGK